MINLQAIKKWPPLPVTLSTLNESKRQADKGSGAVILQLNLYESKQTNEIKQST